MIGGLVSTNAPTNTENPKIEKLQKGFFKITTSGLEKKQYHNLYTRASKFCQ